MTRPMRRRPFLGAMAACFGATATAWAPNLAHANPKLLQNRLDLWANYAKRTRNVMARLVTTRETSLLDEPMVVTGSMVFAGPDILVLRDDGLSGSSTLINTDRVRVAPNQPTLAAPPPVSAAQAEAEAWLADRLLRLFRAPRSEEEGERDVIEGARVNVPRKSYRIELMPARGSVVRKTFRSLTVHLDPVVGAVTQVLIAQTQGDRVKLQFSDHRQNVDDADVNAVIDTVRTRVGDSAEPSDAP